MRMASELANRHLLAAAHCIVIKVGSSSLTGEDGYLDCQALHKLVNVVAKAHKRGQHVVLVSSGAVAAGIAPLGFHRRPKNVRDQQAAAMVGQAQLMSAYAEAFSRDHITVAQVLLTPEDVVDRRHYANVQAALERLLHYGVIPIVNENDAVVTDDLRFGDNDRVAALVAHVVGASALVLCTDVDGLYTAPPTHPGAHLISEISDFSQLESYSITGKGSDVGTGGMSSKVRAADIATAGGVGTLVVATSQLGEALAGKPVGTWFMPRAARKSARDLWLRYSAHGAGILYADPGAIRALEAGGASLLAVGITHVEGTFSAGDLVYVVPSDADSSRAGSASSSNSSSSSSSSSQVPIGQGLVAFSSAEVKRFIGQAPYEHERRRAPRPVIHADDFAHIK